jgi:hypothetical protein
LKGFFGIFPERGTGKVYSPFNPFGAYPYRRAALAMDMYGERCSPVRWFSRKGE